MSDLTSPDPSTKLRPEEARRLLAVVRDLAHEKEPEGHVYGTVPPRKAARVFVAALEQHPYLTLRNLIFALEEAGHAALEDCDQVDRVT